MLAVARGTALEVERAPTVGGAKAPVSWAMLAPVCVGGMVCEGASKLAKGARIVILMGLISVLLLLQPPLIRVRAASEMYHTYHNGSMIFNIVTAHGDGAHT